jgi:hypothetical protein
MPTAALPENPESYADLDAVLTSLRFDPADPVSVQDAIREMNAAIDAKLAPYALDARVADMTKTLKEKYFQAILSRKPPASKLRHCDARLLPTGRHAASRRSPNLELLLGNRGCGRTFPSHGPLPNLPARPLRPHHGRVFRRVRIGHRGDARGSHTPGTFSRGRSLEKLQPPCPSEQAGRGRAALRNLWSAWAVTGAASEIDPCGGDLGTGRFGT